MKKTLLFLMFLAIVTNASAAYPTWNPSLGAGTSEWEDATNWQPNTLPAPGDHVIPNAQHPMPVISTDVGSVGYLTPGWHASSNHIGVNPGGAIDTTGAFILGSVAGTTQEVSVNGGLMTSNGAYYSATNPIVGNSAGQAFTHLNANATLDVANLGWAPEDTGADANIDLEIGAQLIVGRVIGAGEFNWWKYIGLLTGCDGTGDLVLDASIPGKSVITAIDPYVPIWTADFEDGEVNNSVGTGGLNTVAYPATQPTVIADDQYGWQAKDARVAGGTATILSDPNAYSGDNYVEMNNKCLRSDVPMVLGKGLYRFTYWYMIPSGNSLSTYHKVVMKDQTNGHLFVNSETIPFVAPAHDVWFSKSWVIDTTAYTPTTTNVDGTINFRLGIWMATDAVDTAWIGYTDNWSLSYQYVQYAETPSDGINFVWGTKSQDTDAFDLYIGYDEDDVDNATTSDSEYVGQVSSPYNTRDLGIFPDTDIFWRVDEVDTTPATPVVTKGDVETISIDGTWIDKFDHYDTDVLADWWTPSANATISIEDKDLVIACDNLTAPYVSEATLDFTGANVWGQTQKLDMSNQAAIDIVYKAGDAVFLAGGTTGWAGWTTDPNMTATVLPTSTFPAGIPRYPDSPVMQSWTAGEPATGDATSPNFTISGTALKFWTLGWDGAPTQPDATYPEMGSYYELRLASDDSVLFSEVPPEATGTYTEVVWDVTAYQGQEVYFTFADLNSSPGYAWCVLGALQEVGVPDVAPMYVEFEDNAAQVARVELDYAMTHPSAGKNDVLYTAGEWNWWPIALSELTDDNPSIDLANIATMTIGVGDGTSQLAGEFAIDYINLKIPRCNDGWGVNPVDFVGADCWVNADELEAIAQNWLTPNYSMVDYMPREFQDAVEAELEIPQATTAPAIDGVLEVGEWDGAMAFEVAYPDITTSPKEGNFWGPGGAPSGNDKFSNTWYMQWDASNLYIAMSVTDPNMMFSSTADGPYSGQDGLQFEFDLTKDEPVYLEGTSAIYDITADTLDGDRGAAIYRNHAVIGTFTDTQMDLISIESAKLADGYIIELALPWSVIDHTGLGYTPAINDTHGIGFLQLNYSEEATPVLLTACSAFADQWNTVSWKTATLVASNTQHASWAWGTGTTVVKPTDLTSDADDIINLLDLAVVAEQWLENDMWPVWGDAPAQP